jgi:alkylation response protein AidB-like acyl-CoA dehydrogenase
MHKQELIERATQLVPQLAQRAPQTEQQRHIPQETLEALTRAELFRAIVPRQYGGLGLDYDTVLDICIVLGHGCGSTAWCYGIWMSGTWIIGAYPEQIQKECYAQGPDVVATGGFNPEPGFEVTERPHGYHLRGRWSFGSGCDAAQWAVVIAPTPHGPAFFLVPRTRFSIDDNWYVSGLRGTGSKDLVVDTDVDMDYVLQTAELREGRTLGQLRSLMASHHLPFFAIISYALIAPMLGMAYGALAAFKQSIQRSSAMRGGDMSHLVGSQMRVAEATMEMESAHRLMQQQVAALLEQGAHHHSLTVEERLHSRAIHAYVATLCVRAVDRLFAASGGRALFDANPLQRFHRDIHAASHHATLSWDIVSEQYGRVLLGLDPTYMRF